MTGPAIFAVTRVEADCRPRRWAWAEENAAAIATHWAARRALQPRLFDGPVLLATDIRVASEVLRATYFQTTYAPFLAFKDFGFPDDTVVNAFAMAALRGTCGAFVLGVMGPHTANAGNVYFPAGTPDLSDLRSDGTVDLAGSVVRELEEETALTAAEYAPAAEWHVVRDGATLALMRPVALPGEASAMRDLIRARLAREAESEFADIVLARDARDIDRARMPRFLQAYLAWAFERDFRDTRSAT